MAIEKVKEYFIGTELEGKVIELPESSATVELAANALDTEPDRIAKTLSYLVDDKPILIVTSGMSRVDNKKYKARFQKKAKMIPFDEVEGYIGHAPGGVCPFAYNDGVDVYLDISLKKYDTVFPAAGSDNSAVETSLEQLERYTGFKDWIDVCIHQSDNNTADEAIEKVKRVADAVGKNSKVVAEATQKAVNTVGKGGRDTVVKAKDTFVNAIDQDGDGQFDGTDLILMALKVPGVRINRTEFLRKELFKYCSQETINKAIETSPAEAGVDPAIIEKSVDETIIFERNAVSKISTALGIPGGVAMAATIPADIAQYYGYMLRAAQKMLYLYSFPEIENDQDGIMLDSETLNSLTVCLGVMYGVANANNAIKAMAKALATGVEKQLMKRALTKGTIYPIVKSIAKWFSVQMTKEIFAGFFKKAIPVIGGAIGGGLTFATFKPCCSRLRETLRDTSLSNPNHKDTEEEIKLYEDIKNDVIVDLEAEEIREVINNLSEED